MISLPKMIFTHAHELRNITNYIILGHAFIHTDIASSTAWKDVFYLQLLRAACNVSLSSLDRKMKTEETPSSKAVSDHKSKEGSCNRSSSCTNPFRITLLRVFPLLTFITGVVVLALGFGNGNLKSEILRMAGVILVTVSMFWFVLGNFVDFCMNGFGQGVRDTEKDDNTSAAQTEVTIEDSLVRGSWI